MTDKLRAAAEAAIGAMVRAAITGHADALDGYAEALRAALAEQSEDWDRVAALSLSMAERVRVALAEQSEDWDRVAALESSLREHMAEIHRLRAALAEPEPVAWLYTNVQSGDMEASTDPDWFDDGRELWNSQPLYTHPPRREWVSLTDEEIASLSDNVQFGSRMAKLARIIEAALKEKNRD